LCEANLAGLWKTRSSLHHLLHLYCTATGKFT
jgi:hypothetical protein